MKIYTKTGDDGTTGLLGGERVRKCDDRIDCYGTVDELNASLGLAIAGRAPCEPVTTPVESLGEIVRRVRTIQSDLFVVGSHLTTAEESPYKAKLPPLDETLYNRLEMEIDWAEGRVSPLRNFILPGGTELSARLHVSRTLCRRAERQLVKLSLDRPLPQVILTFFNRLSDWLFVHARLANEAEGVADVLWKR